jgi:hypothetical protein
VDLIDASLWCFDLHSFDFSLFLDNGTANKISRTHQIKDARRGIVMIFRDLL